MADAFAIVAAAVVIVDAVSAMDVQGQLNTVRVKMIVLYRLEIDWQEWLEVYWLVLSCLGLDAVAESIF
jgi:hypothetical protein